MSIENKQSLCQCGCGRPAPLSDRNESCRNYILGQPMRFIKNHHPKGEHHHNWKGGRRTRKDGYVIVWDDGDHNKNRKYVLEHIKIVEELIGKKLPKNAVIHHVNGNNSDNTHSNLIVCENHKYHALLHRRQSALSECGHADWRRCKYCKILDDPEKMKRMKNHNAWSYYHQECSRIAQAKWRLKNAEKHREYTRRWSAKKREQSADGYQPEQDNQIPF